MKPLEIGEPAPDFVVESASGRTLHELIRSSYAPALVYFYPADFSPACTAQACMIRDMSDEHALGETVLLVGVSPQSKALHERFKKARKLPQILVSDRSKQIASSYGAKGLFGLFRRVSFIVGTDLRIAGSAQGTLTLREHRAMVQAYLQSLQPAAPGA